MIRSKVRNDLYYRQYRMDYFASECIDGQGLFVDGKYTQKAGECARSRDRESEVPRDKAFYSR